MANDRKQWVLGTACLVALGLAVAVGGMSTKRASGRHCRVTAATHALFWLSPHAGGSLAALFGDRFRPLARQGRNFGLAFASTHSIHLLLVIWLYRLSPEPPTSAQDTVFFSIGLLWMYLLALLSIEHLSKMLGPSLWRKLRLVGMEYIMLAFQSDFLLQSLPADAKHLLLYLPFAALGVAGMALRIIGWALKMQRDSTYGMFSVGRLWH